eukprot:684712-Pelagomonas_calceolata.AAC.1
MTGAGECRGGAGKLLASFISCKEAHHSSVVDSCVRSLIVLGISFAHHPQALGVSLKQILMQTPDITDRKPSKNARLENPRDDCAAHPLSTTQLFWFAPVDGF